MEFWNWKTEPDDRPTEPPERSIDANGTKNKRDQKQTNVLLDVAYDGQHLT